MERALELTALSAALGQHTAGSELPSAAELQSMMADAEIRLFTGRPESADGLLRTAWYLHGVASTPTSVDVYGEPRRRRAFQVSAHIFDVILNEPDLPSEQRLRLAFAAQVGYHRGELQPNAIATYRSAEEHVISDLPILDHIRSIALEAGVVFLGLNRRQATRHFGQWRTQLRRLRSDIDVDTLADTMFGAVYGVVEGAHALLQFLTFGDYGQLERAQAVLKQAVVDEASGGDLDARWVAAHLFALSAEMENGSVWSAFPPDMPRSAQQAMTLTDPPILTLWPPQLELLKTSPSALDPATKRVVLSLPTSAGKTLMAQLLVVAHLAKEGTSVCYVAPMRSLGREVRAALRSRLVPLRRELGRDLPDFFMDLEGFPLSSVLLGDPAAQPDVDIMTPERLSHLLKNDAGRVLDRYGLFIFDEAHLLGEEGRGFALEAVISFLNWRTANTDQRIILLSAALGNRGQVMTWLDSENEGLLYESEWRGPRRLNAVFTTRVDWNPIREEAVKSDKLPRRIYFPVHGEIRLRPADNAKIHGLELTQPVGEIAFRASAAGVRERKRDQNHSTAMYRAVAQLAAAIGHAGSVLVVTSTRDDARRMAQAIADLLEPSTRSRPIADFVRSRLGGDHPLSSILQKGVAYHHAALPIDILEAIEEGVRSDTIQFIASTTSLTEGVNLPVRTVIISESGYEGQPVGALLRGARLLNAIGRAGRACKECEGWVVLALNQEPRVSDFARLKVDADELLVQSRMADDTALAALAELDAAMREREDAVFAAAAAQARDFISFIWFLLASEEDQHNDPVDADVDGALASTLAYVQLDEAGRALLLRVASQVRNSYVASDPTHRRRWARYGTSIATGRLIDVLADELAAAAENAAALVSPDDTIALFELIRAFERLYEAPEAPRPWSFRRSRSGSSDRIEPQLGHVLREWVHGGAMATLADTFLNNVPNRDFRIEQIVDATAQHFEHFLSWTVGAIVDEANRRLEQRGSEKRCSSDLALFIRYGVDSAQALELLTAGFRSREMAKTVADHAIADGVAVADMRGWIGAMSIVQWHGRFTASTSDLLDLLEYARLRRGNLLHTLLETGEASVEVEVEPSDTARVVTISPEGEEQPSPLAIRSVEDGGILGRVPTRMHAEVQTVLDIGLELAATLTGLTVVMSLSADD